MNRNIRKYIVFSIVVLMLSACNFFEVPDNGPIIKGVQVENIDFTKDDYDALQQIFTLKNPLMKELVYSYEKLSEEVLLIGSQAELQKLCPDSVQVPVIDFERHCFIFALVATPSTQSEVRKVELYLQDTGEATLYTEILSTSMDGKVGLAMPYAVFNLHADRIKNLKILSKNRFY